MRFGLVIATFAAAAIYPPLAAVAIAAFVLTSRPVRRPLLSLPTAMVISAGVLTALAAQSTTTSLVATVGQGTLLFVFLLAGARFRRADALAVGLGLSAALTALFAAGVVQVAVQGADQATLFSYHPNIAGAQALLTVFGLAAVVGIVPRGRRPALVGALVLGVLAIVYTGSRSTLIGLGVGALVLALAAPFVWRRRGFRWAALVVLIALAGSGALAALLRPSETGPNLIVNSELARGGLGWVMQGGSFIEPDAYASGEPAVRLSHDEPKWQFMLAPRRPLPVGSAETLVFSLDVRPLPDALAGTLIRIEALDADGRFIGRAGRSGWTTGDESAAGGRLTLPVAPAGAWQRFSFALPPLPVGTQQLLLMVASDQPALGTYGHVARPQLQVGEVATSYVPGATPGFEEYADRYFGAVWRRLDALRTPLATSGGRLSNWLFGLRLAAHKPFLGYGFGSSQGLWERFAPRYVANPIAHPHNFYLQLLVEGGTLSLAAFLAWVGAAIARLGRSRSWAAWAMIAGTVALLAANVFDVALAQPPVAGLFVALLAFGLAIAESADDRSRSARSALDDLGR